MKVLQLITGLGQGGAEQVVYDLATRLDPARYQVAVCSVLELSPGRDACARRLREAGVEVLSLGLTGKWQIHRAARLGALLRERRPDLLHAHLFHANLLARWYGHRAGVPAILSTVHIAERRWRPWRFWIDRRTDALGTLTVCVSHAALTFQAERTGLPADRFAVIPNGIDIDRFVRPQRPRDTVRAELGIPVGARLIGSVGRLDPQKGYRHLIPAFADLAHEMSDLELVIAGDGCERRRLDALARGSGVAERIHLIGARGDVPDLLHAFDLFVMPSVYEGFGLTLVEAMAAGVSVLASEIDSLPELLGVGEPGGPCGRLVVPGDPAALAVALREALGYPLPGAVERARSRAQEHYDVNLMIRKYAELYDSFAV